jgi:tetratricopeptide (TPR) repeat protein
MQTGARVEAIEAYRRATSIDPRDARVWRSLASAQFAEAAYTDAIESYRRAFELDETNGISFDENARLQYADALRLAGRTDEARPIYQQLARSNTPPIAQAARERLAGFATAEPVPSRLPSASPSPGEERVALDPNRQVTAIPTPPVMTQIPAPTPRQAAATTPAEHYERGVQLWSSNRAAALNEFRAAGTPDARYYLGLNSVENRNLQSLNQAALIGALGHFSAARGGRFSAQAARYHQQLTQEFDRRRGTGQ